MMSYVSSAPPVKTRLAKPKTHENTSQTPPARPSRSLSSSSKSKSRQPPPDISPEQWTSYFDLKSRSDAPKNLKQQLKQSFPEATRKLSLDSFRRSSSDSTNTTDTMGVKDRYPKPISTAGASSAASVKSASSTLNSPSPLARQLSVVHEGPTIDIASAIRLLQELKKTASPEELVALHRALLPTKDSEIVVDQPDAQPAQRSSRRNSKLPPGLNTRGEPGDDLLRKLGDEISKPRPKVQHADSQDTHSSTDRSSYITAASHRSDETNEENANRAETPTEQEYSQTGVYRTGTLRITNGAASPEPGNMLREALDNDEQQGEEVLPADPIQETPTSLESQTGRPMVPSTEFFSAAAHASNNTEQNSEPDTPVSPDFHPGRPVVPSTESFPGAFRILHSEKRKTSRPLPPPPEPDSRRNSDASEKYGAEAVQQFQEFDQSDEPTQGPCNAISSPNDVSPVILSQPPPPKQRSSYNGTSAPRFQYADSSVENSPSEARGSVAQFASRLSTVYGEDVSDEDMPGTPNDALAKLTGAPRVRGPRELRSIKSLRSLRSQRPASMSHADSGYGSSDTSSQRQVPSPKPIETTLRAQDMIPRNPTTQEKRDDQFKPDNDGESLYTFSQFLSTANTSSETPPDSPSSPRDLTHKRNTSKKDLPSFLGLRDKMPMKRMSLPAGELSTSESYTSLNSSVVSEKSGKPSKKLRKPMPEHLKRQISSRVSPASEVSVNECPLVSAEMNKSLEERYFQPLPADKDLNRRASSTSIPQSIWNDGSRESERNVKIHDDDVDDAPVRRKNPFHRKRSVSRGRKSHMRGEANESQVDAGKTGAAGFLRSLSRSRSRRRASIDSADCNTPTTKDPNPPADVTSASPADTPKAQANNETPRVKGTEPWRTGPPPKQKSKSMGMTEEMASELARSRSRDVGSQARAASTDRPRMATPKPLVARGHTRSPSVGPPKSGRMVEHFVPGWHSKPASPTPTPPRADTTPRPYSMYADSIPPMPEIPVDVAAKAAMANKLKAKKKNHVQRGSIDTPSASPTPSQQNSAASSPNVGRVKRAVMEREEQERRLEDRLAKDRENERLHPANRQTPKEDVHVAVRELQGSSSEQSSIMGIDSRPSTADRAEIGVARSPSLRQEAGHANQDKQAANLWNERRKSLGTYLPNSSYAFSEDGSEVSAAPRIASPEIVVSRYITPIGNDIAARARTTQDPTSEAARHADLYRSLLDEEDYCPPGFDIPRTDSAYSSASSTGTVPIYHDLPTSLVSRAPRPAQRNVSGVTTTSSVYSNQYTALPRTRSPGGRVRTPSGNFYAYEPNTHASEAERSRASSLSKLHPTGKADTSGSNIGGTLSPASSTDGLSTIFSDTVTISSCGGTIRAKPKDPNRRHNFPDPQQTRHRSKSRPTRPRLNSRNSSNLADRYSGGLAWEWDRDSGFGGSAGTRLNGETGTRRKGQKLASSYGVDLGDVPIFLSHSPDGISPVQQQKKGYFGPR